MAWPTVPAMVSRAEAFDALVLDTAGRFRDVLGRRWSQVEFAVQDVPAEGPLPWETSAPLARLFPAERGLPARVVLYRRPIEALTVRGDETAALVHEVVLDQVAQLLGVDPGEIDPPG
nr:metallopeptidase family protein [Janibacter alkaliphilus]